MDAANSERMKHSVAKYKERLDKLQPKRMAVLTAPHTQKLSKRTKLTNNNKRTTHAVNHHHGSESTASAEPKITARIPTRPTKPARKPPCEKAALVAQQTPPPLRWLSSSSNTLGLPVKPKITKVEVVTDSPEKTDAKCCISNTLGLPEKPIVEEANSFIDSPERTDVERVPRFRTERTTSEMLPNKMRMKSPPSVLHNRQMLQPKLSEQAIFTPLIEPEIQVSQPRNDEASTLIHAGIRYEGFCLAELAEVHKTVHKRLANTRGKRAKLLVRYGSAILRIHCAADGTVRVTRRDH